MKFPWLLALALAGCTTDSAQPDSLDGKYESGFIGSEPADSGVVRTSESLRKDMLILDGDSLRYFTCTYEIPLRNGTPGGDTLREVQFTGMKTRITADSMFADYRSYGRTGTLPPGKFFVDTMSFGQENISGGFRTLIRRGRGGFEMEFNGEKGNFMVAFKKVDRLEL